MSKYQSGSRAGKSMGNKRIVWSFDAIEDLDQMRTFLRARLSEEQIRSRFEALQGRIQILNTYPRIGPVVSFSIRLNKEVRTLGSGSLRVFYAIFDEEIRILRIWSPKQDPNALFFG